ncbi:MAG: hypothetical protein II075_04495 [Bacteroidales bacterium]|nr:hypothetical protein [Bacteroidales bacterium]MBQ2098942.1 hypothetical protein [Bacteroidales bacterium]
MATTNPTTNETHTIDNGTASVKWLLAYAITFILPVGLLLYAHWERPPYYSTCVAVSGALLLAHILILLVGPSYFYYSNEGKNIHVRNVSDYPLFRKYNEIQFLKTNLISYKIDKQLFGIKKMLSLRVRGIDPQTKQKKEVDIEKINISSISKTDYKTLVQSLDQMLKK